MSNSATSPDGSDAKIADVLFRTRSTLRRVELALENFPDVPDRERTLAAMHNVVVTGRSVTFVLQNMQNVAPGFHEWYSPWQEEMRQDPLLKYFKDLRNKIEKQGIEGAGHATFIKSFNFSRDLPPPPPNWIRFIMGDENAGSGWEVRLEDGTTQMMHVTLPEEKVRSWLYFENLPNEHLGSPIADNSLEHVCQLYFQYLRRLVDAAEKEFGYPG